MAMTPGAPPADGYPLPCGHELNTLWEHVAGGHLDAHERDCEHCRSAAASARALQDVLAVWRAEPIEPPAELASRIMAVVRAEAGRGDVMPLPSPYGPVQISRAAVAVVLRYAADTVAGVRARDCRIHAVGTDPDGSAVVAVDLGLALAYGTGPAEATLEQVRSQVRAAAQGQVGLRVGVIDLRVDDVWLPGSPGRGGPVAGDLGRETR